ncbi:MAG: peptide-methionine (S)-S-oxide reductase MsrA [Filifactoraceae bacterium]
MEKTIYLAGGCFWGVEKFFKMINGVIDTEVGYANGNTINPTYEDVCKKGTNHAETVKVVYNSDKISTSALLSLFFKIIDPTSLNRQGNDIGYQYRTGIYYICDEELPVIILSISQLQNQYPNKEIVIELAPLENYYPAEEYHQDYLEKNPNGYCHLTSTQYAHASNFKGDILL